MKTGEDFRREFPPAEVGFQEAAYRALQGLHEKKEARTMAKNKGGNGGKNPYAGNAAGPHGAINKPTSNSPSTTIHKGGDLRGK